MDLSIPAQLQAMHDYAREHGWAIVEEFIEPGVSAKTTERPALQRMLAKVRDRESQISVVLVHKIDRLARNVADHATIRALLKQLGIQLASVVEKVDDSVSGQLVENIMASIAQFYSANLGEEVKKGQQQKILRGEWPHLPPVGYVQVRNEQGRGSHVEVHPRLGPFITQMFELYATGHYSLHALAERMSDEGFRSKTGERLSQAQVLRMLHNPFYAGRMRWKGQDLRGAHRPLVSTNTFKQVHEVLRRRFRYVGVKNSVPGFPLRGWALCAACRGRMTGERHDKWRYYRCSRQSYKRERCSAKFCNVNRAHEDLERICSGIQLKRQSAAVIRKRVRAFLAERSSQRSSRVQELETQRRRLVASERDLTEAFARSDITAKRFNDGIEEIRRSEKAVGVEISAVTSDPSQAMKAVDRFLDLATSIWDVYLSLSDAKRAELLRTVFDKVVLGPSGVVSYTLTPTFHALANPKSDGSEGELLVQAVLGSVV